MVTSTVPPYTTTPTAPPRGKWLRYVAAIIAANGFLWGVAIAYLRTAEPSFTSQWAVTLPSAGTTTDINLPNIGDASAEVESPYQNANTRDPRENYRFIATSAPVLRAAAEELNLTPSEFGKPRVQIIDNTTLITFELSGETPEAAQAKSVALYEAIEEQLEQLRLEEAAQRDAGTELALAEAQDKLELAQQRLSEYKARSGLVASTQLEQLSTNIEQLRRERAVVRAQQRYATARLGQLSNSLGVSASQASDAFTLNADALFQQNLRDYSEATATLDVLSTQLGPNHPAIVREQIRQESAEQAMLTRGQQILGQSVDQALLIQLNTGRTVDDGGSGREMLFQETVEAQVDQQGLAAQAMELDRQIAQLEARLQAMAQHGSQLEALLRDVTIAEAVFSSTLARLDLSKADTLGSYPQIQLLTPPSLPDEPTSPKTMLVLLGGAAGSFLITMGLLLLWWRDRRPTPPPSYPALPEPALPPGQPSFAFHQSFVGNSLNGSKPSAYEELPINPS